MLKRLSICTLLLLSLSACTWFGSSDNAAPQPDPYYDTFSDIPIPRGLEANSKDTSIIYGQNNLQTGVQLLKGRVEVSSLTAVMAANMAKDNWTLRSALRSSHTVLVFEKPDRFCTLYIYDGMWNTEMRIFVTSKLTNGAVPNNTYPGAPAASSGGASGGNYSQPLQQ